MLIFTISAPLLWGGGGGGWFLFFQFPKMFETTDATDHLIIYSGNNRWFDYFQIIPNLLYASELRFLTFMRLLKMKEIWGNFSTTTLIAETKCKKWNIKEAGKYKRIDKVALTTWLWMWKCAHGLTPNESFGENLYFYCFEIITTYFGIWLWSEARSSFVLR